MSRGVEKRALRILVTAGPTVEPIDAVRFLSNHASGRLGFEIAAWGQKRGHRVSLVAGPTEIPAPPGVRCIRIGSARQMFSACRREFAHADALVMSAAVSDYRPAGPAARKRHKKGARIRLELVRNPDILTALCRRKGKRLAVGFALENELSVRRARAKMRAKGCDAIVLNTLASMGGAGFRGALLEGRRTLCLGPTKCVAALAIIRWIESKF